MQYSIALLVGALGGLGGIYLGRALNRERELFGYCLFVAAIWYVSFGIWSGASFPVLIPQLLGGVVFAAFGLLGLRYSILFIAAGWGLHAVWDLISPAISDISYAPWWTGPACLGFDPVVALYLVARSRGALPATG